jgi:hypothetical protein
MANARARVRVEPAPDDLRDDVSARSEHIRIAGLPLNSFAHGSRRSRPPTERQRTSRAHLPHSLCRLRLAPACPTDGGGDRVPG